MISGNNEATPKEQIEVNRMNDLSVNADLAPDQSSNTDPTTAHPESDVEIVDYKKLSDEYLDSLQRMKAEFDNYRKRIERDRQQMTDACQSSLVAQILPVLDGFDAALKNESHRSLEDVLKGYQLLHQSLVSVLEKSGLVRLKLKGEQFDPQTAEAVAIVPHTCAPTDAVIEEVQAGYMFKQKLLRAAKVLVAAESPPKEHGPTKEEKNVL